MIIGDEMARSARALLDALGFDVTLSRSPVGAYDPATGTGAKAAMQTTTVRVYFEAYRESEVNGTLIERGDRRAVIAATGADGAALSMRPAPDDLLIGERGTVRIVSVEERNPSGSSAVYICQVRE